MEYAEYPGRQVLINGLLRDWLLRQVCILAKTSKISSKGCYVDTQNPLPVGTFLNMVISHGEGSFATKGKVIYVHEGVGMGIVFPDSTGDQLNILRSWLAESSRTDTP